MTSFACPRRAPDTLPLDALVHPGFGLAFVYAKGGPTLSRPLGEDATAQDAEDFARRGGTSRDWRLRIDGPLSSATYKRQAAGVWVLIERSEGFA
jgi:predicted NUDIX family NTP pyrophosphohydrolase